MYHDLIVELRIFETVCHHSDKEEIAALAKKAADAIDGLQKKLQDSESDNINLTGWLAEEHAKHLWIPVTERLPEEYEYVLCRTDYGMEVGYHRDEWGQDEWTTGKFASGSFDVTHWMPLPEPPKDGES